MFVGALCGTFALFCAFAVVERARCECVGSGEMSS